MRLQKPFEVNRKWHPGLIPYSEKEMDKALRISRVNHLLRRWGYNLEVAEQLAAVTIDNIGTAGTWSSGTTGTASCTTGATANRAILLLITWDNGATATTVSSVTDDDAGSSDPYTIIGQHAASARGTALAIATAPTASTLVTATVTFSASYTAGNFGKIQAYALSNVDQATPSSGYTSGGSVTSLAAITSAVGDMCFITTASNGNIGAITPGTEDLTGSFFKAQHADGAATVTFSWTNAGRSESACNIKAAAAASSFSKLAGSIASLASASGLAG